MPDIVHVNYAQTGQSTKIDRMGMREMQERAYEARDAAISAFESTSCVR